MEFAVNGNSVSTSVKLPAIPSGRKKPASSKTPINLLTPSAGASFSPAALVASQRRPRAHSMTTIAVDSSPAFPTEVLTAEPQISSTEDFGDRSRRMSAPQVSMDVVGAVPTTISQQPISMMRAKVWTIEVENAFRYQLAGFRDQAVISFINYLVCLFIYRDV